MPPDGVNTKLILTNTLLDTLSTTSAEIDSNTAELVTAATAAAEAFATLSGYLQLAIGTFSEAEVGTVLYELRQIKNCICQLANGAEPTPTAPNGCDEPLPSLTDRLITDDDFPGRGFIEWDSVLPQGVELSNDVYPELPTGIELHLTGDSTYYLWVQSTCPSFKTTPESASVYPTGSWVAIDGPNTIAVNLADSCAGKAFLCIDPDLGFVDCVQRTSSIVETVHATVDNSDRVRLSVPLDGLGLPLTDTIDVGGGNTLTSDSGLTWAASDANGYTFEYVSGARIRIWWKIVSAGFADHVFTTSGSPFEITDATTVWGVDNWQDPVGDVEEPFEIIICPPSPG
jgi:hypothetical protein